MTDDLDAIIRDIHSVTKACLRVWVPTGWTRPHPDYTAPAAVRKAARLIRRQVDVDALRLCIAFALANSSRGGCSAALRLRGVLAFIETHQQAIEARLRAA